MIISDLSIEICRPMEVVYAYLMDVSNYILWQSGLIEIKSTNGMQIGSQIVFTTIGIGKTFNLTAVVTENQPPMAFRVKSNQGPLTFDLHYVLESNRDDTILTIFNRIETKSAFKIAETVLQSITDSKYESDLKTLKALLEAE